MSLFRYKIYKTTYTTSEFLIQFNVFYNPSDKINDLSLTAIKVYYKRRCCTNINFIDRVLCRHSVKHMG